MKIIAKLVGCLCMLLFLAFAWLSHSGVLPGSAAAHGWGGFGAFVLAFAGWLLLMAMSEEDGSHKMVNVFSFVYGVLLILSAVVYTFLSTSNLIGPYGMLDRDVSLVFFVGVLHYALAIASMFMMNAAVKDNIV
ncbi:MAG: hypothetical protein WAP51_01090 [Candidatus Sungiibacteriota bacterium]